MTRFDRAPCALILCCVPILLLAQQPPKRTLLLELNNIPPEKMNKGLLMFDEYRRDAVVSYVRGTVMLLATRAEADVPEGAGLPVHSCDRRLEPAQSVQARNLRRDDEDARSLSHV